MGKRLLQRPLHDPMFDGRTARRFRRVRCAMCPARSKHVREVRIAKTGQRLWLCPSCRDIPKRPAGADTKAGNGEAAGAIGGHGDVGSARSGDAG
jgi:hypothetical protein